MQPIVAGRIVRYVDFQGREWPAIIVAVVKDTNCDLMVFTDERAMPRHNVSYDSSPNHTGACVWHWPPAPQNAAK